MLAAMLCAKCHQNEATIHFTTVVDGAEEESVHLCEDCAPPTGFDLNMLDQEQIEALSLVGKKCEFCGREAFSGEMRAGGGSINWCFDCGLEFGVIFRELLLAERPESLQRTKDDRSFLSFCSDLGLLLWSASASQRATKTLKERRQQDDRDKSS